jgi:cell division control protein 6
VVVYVNVEDYFKRRAEDLGRLASKFKNPYVFDLNAVPERIYERRELVRIVDGLAEYSVMGIPSNFIIYGSKGSGKTISILHVLKILGRYGLKTFYVRARECPTSYNIYRKMSNISSLGYHIDFLRRNALREYGEKSIIVIDDADFLEDFELLNFFSRNSKASMIVLAQNIKFGGRIDDATYSSLQPLKIYFSEYNADELNQILRMRAEDGLNEWDDSALGLISAIVARDYRGDARIAIRSLFKAVLAGWGDVRRIVEEASRDVEEMSLKELRDMDIIVLYIVSRIRESNKAYREFSNFMMKTERRTLSKTSFFRILNYLQNLGLITQVRKRVGRYFTVEIDPLVDEGMVEEEVKKRFLKRDEAKILQPKQ